MARLPPLNALRCFEAAARHRSFSKAADELHVTQSAVSHQIRLLEDWFSTSLFKRSGRETAPTQKGEELAEALASAFNIMAEACKRTGNSESNEGITIGVLPSIATIWLIPRLQAFFAARPDIPVRIVYAIHGRPMNEDDADVAIVWGPKEQAPAGAQMLLSGATVAVGNPALIAREGPFTSPAQLTKAHLLHDTDKAGWQSFMKELGQKHIGPAPGPVFEDFNMLRAAALAGQGLALCPHSLVADDVAAGRLQLLFEGTAIRKDYGYWLVEADQDGLANAKSVAAFKAWLLDVAQ